MRGGKSTVTLLPPMARFSPLCRSTRALPLRAVVDSPPWPTTSGDETPRLLPKLALGGVWRKLLWSFSFGFLYRAEAVASGLPASTAQASPARAA